VKNAAFYARLHARGLTAAALAAAIGSSRAHVTLVLGNTPGRGGLTRRKLAPLLTEAERELLGWSVAGALVERSTRKTPLLDRFRVPWRPREAMPTPPLASGSLPP
jgi:hypothetical protein